MNQHYSDIRKIDPTRKKPDGSPADPNRIEIGPTDLAFAEWAAAGIQAPDLARMRQYRLDRLVAAINERDYCGVVLTDPLNIRYATDATNMQLWNTHNPFRACLVLANGHMVLWEYKNAPFLASFNPLVSEVRPSRSLFYMSSGDGIPRVAMDWAGQVLDLVKDHVGDNRRLAIDKIMVHGLKAMEAEGFEVFEGEELTEKARMIKGPDEIAAMRCAMHACEAAMYVMEEACRPGLSEDDIWAVLHAENIKRGGEWIETRLLSSGPRTFPWFQECGPRIVQADEIVAFDTDLIGAYGMCVDISRTWFTGETPTRIMKDHYQLALEHIRHNQDLVAPGVTIAEIVEKSHRVPEEFWPNRYSCLFHGVGLCDEWPHIAQPEHFREEDFDYPLEPGMMLCVEACIGTAEGGFTIKLEDQLLVTETGVENLTAYPFDAKFLG